MNRALGRLLFKAILFVGAVPLGISLVFFAVVVLGLAVVAAGIASIVAAVGATKDAVTRAYRYDVYGWQYCWLIRMLAMHKGFTKALKAA